MVQSPATESGEHIFGWLETLDELTYYELFGVRPDAGDDEIRAAFHRFCDAFHPDRHLGRSPEERAALTRIFKRGTEACLVLSDRALRAQYDQQLSMEQGARPPRITQRPQARSRSQSPGAIALEEAARSPSSRPFARRAEELMRTGDLRQAKLQLVMANHLDPGNGVLESALKDVEARLAASK